jgi:TolB-like protein/class 3 adenylate cyclase/Tfp pilus assembly protein PilF
MALEDKTKLELEIAHVLFIDTVGYSKLRIHEQRELFDELNRLVRDTAQFRAAEASGKLTRLPTGDGMALVFTASVETPVECALAIARALKQHPRLAIRMGIHSGPVSRVVDVNDQVNVTGAGINVAQRVMDCGEAGHILLSQRAADDLAEFGTWQSYLHGIGPCEVKHGARIELVNLYNDEVGNPRLPAQCKEALSGKKAKTRSNKLLAAVAVTLLLGGAIAFIYWNRIQQGWLQPGRVLLAKSVAVLPFENLSDEKQNVHFTEGVHDEILTNLAKVADLKVISRTSVMQYTGEAKRNLREIAAALGVAHIVEGTVQREGQHVRINAQLIDARTDTHIWSKSFDRDLADVFAMQSEVAEQIVGELKAKLSPEEKAAIEERPTADVVAYELYVQARNLSAMTVFSSREKESLALAVNLLQQAITRDPGFFLAYYELALTHDRAYILGVDHTPARLALAEKAVETARRLRPNSGEAHLANACHLYSAYLDYDHARAELVLARQLLPNDSFVFELGGYIDRRQSRWEDSTRNFERGLELDPRNVYILQQLSINYHYLRRYADRKAVLDRVLAIVPGDVATRCQRSLIELDWHADPKPLHETIATVLAQEPASIRELADQWLSLALSERDFASAELALKAMGTSQCIFENIELPPEWCQGLVARAKGDSDAAHAAFQQARPAMEKIVRDQPDYAAALSVLGLLDAGLGRNEDAIREGTRAVELLPISKDSINGTSLLENLAIIYAWTGETDRALETLSYLAGIPATLSYGHLSLRPEWDPLRNDPRFAKIMASLAPKN